MLARILSRNIRITVGGEVFFVAQNVDWDLQQEADDLKEDFLNQNRFEKDLTLDKMPGFLIKRGLLSPTYDKELDGLSLQLNKALVDYFLGYQEVLARPKNKLKIIKTRQAISKIRDVLSPYEAMTYEAIAGKVREDFILSRTIRDRRGDPIDSSLIDNAKIAYYRKLPNASQLRLIARTDPWINIWRIKKSDAFAVLPLSDYQVLLAIYSRMYDSMYECPDKPSADVINDDDATDGWFIHQSEKTPKDGAAPAKKQHAEEIVFLYDKDNNPDNSPERIKEVYGSNSEEAQAIQKLRMRELEKSKTGVMKIEDFRDIKQLNRNNKNEK